MKTLDLFSGLGGWSQAFKDRGHFVITVDNEQKFNPSICKDIMLMTKEDLEPYDFQVILASPPCNCFSIASCYRHWKDGQPTDEATRNSIKLVKHTFKLINELKPTFWVVENPMGMLRHVIGKPDYEISQCRYGRSIMKPTDLWGMLPRNFIAKKCKNGNPDHEKASRSAKTGLQGINNSFSNLGMRGKDERAKIPYGLSLAVCEACENELGVIRE